MYYFNLDVVFFKIASVEVCIHFNYRLFIKKKQALAPGYQ